MIGKKINFEAACLHYKHVLENAFTKRQLDDSELNFLVDYSLNTMSFKDLYYTYIIN